ncbi:hypothetical protein FACS1894208_01250 [Clostridia bacterium]|nr:hypothetical protein FACS1894208_01250 [Clostridia bacterium]
MEMNERIVSALSTIAPTAPDSWIGNADEYITFSFNVAPEEWADDRALNDVYSVSVHFFAPHGKESCGQRGAIKSAIFNEFEVQCSIVNASDGDGQHYVFEFEVTDTWRD